MAKPQKKSKGQSTIEYIILVAAVIGGLLVFLSGTFNQSYERSINSALNGMENMAERVRVGR